MEGLSLLTAVNVTVTVLCTQMTTAAVSPIIIQSNESTDFLAVCGCLNGGTCNGSTCLCPLGYAGRLCESKHCVVSCGKNKKPSNSNCSCGEWHLL